MSILRLFHARKQKKRLRADTIANPADLYRFEGIDDKTPIGDLKFTVVDIETTGLNSRKHSIASIGAVKVEKRQVVLSSTFYKEIKLEPTAINTEESIKIHHIIPSDLKSKPSLKQALKSFIKHSRNTIFVGHHVLFDKKFITRSVKSLYKTGLYATFLDTSRLAYFLSSISDPRGYYFPNLPQNSNFSLDNLALKNGIPILNRHNALSDALLTAKIFLILLKKLENTGNMKTYKDLKLVASV